MKKIVCLVLAIMMLASVAVMASATTDYTNGTKVEYVGKGTEAYTVKVPAVLTLSAEEEVEGTVTLTGTWPSTRKITVTADSSVLVTNKINDVETGLEKTLTVRFAGIEKAGDNTETKTYEETVYVAAITDALFGTWSGTFNYTVTPAAAE